MKLEAFFTNLWFYTIWTETANFITLM